MRQEEGVLVLKLVLRHSHSSQRFCSEVLWRKSCFTLLGPVAFELTSGKIALFFSLLPGAARLLPQMKIIYPSKDLWDSVSSFFISSISRVSQRVLGPTRQSQWVGRLPSFLYYRTFDIFSQSPADLFFSPGLGLTLRHLQLGFNFNDSLDHLPPTLTHLSLPGLHFDRRIDHLPPALTHLQIEGFFNQPVDYLPEGLTHLSLGPWFDQPLDHLPGSLTHLWLSNRFDQTLDHLPGQLTHLIFRQSALFPNLHNHFHQSLDHLPESLTHLTVGGRVALNNFDHLPVRLRFLSIGSQFSRIDLCCDLDHLPCFLEELHLHCFVSRCLDHLPCGLTKLSIHSYHHSKPLDHLPETLTHLTVTQKAFCKFHHLPSRQLRFVKISSPFCSTLNHLPPCVQHLVLSVNQSSNPYLDHLPEGLLRLDLEGDVCCPLDHLPPSLLILNVKPELRNPDSSPYSYPFPLDYLPPNLIIINVPQSKIPNSLP